MKTKGVKEAKQDLSGCIRESQKEPVVIMSHGKPVSVLMGVTGYDFDDLSLMTNTEFWRMIQQRRKQRTYSHEDVGEEVFGARKQRPRKIARKRAS